MPRCLCLFIVSMLFSDVLVAQAVYDKEERFVKIVSRYEIECDENTKRLIFRICLPQSIEYRQEVGGASFTPKPDRIYNEKGKMYAEFDIAEPYKLKQIDMVIPLKLYKCDYNILSKTKGHITEPDSVLARFLKEEKSVEINNPHIQRTAKELQAKDKLRTVRNIFYFVINHIRYKANGIDLGAEYALMNKIGDCSEFSHLFVALCRANGIPARPIVGYVSHLAENQCHAWAEVYFDDIGWVPFEPTGKNRDNYKNMKNNYVYLYYTANDGESIHYAGYQYKYRGANPVVKTKITIQ